MTQAPKLRRKRFLFFSEKYFDRFGRMFYPCVMMKNNEIKIKALWTQYGPRFHYKNRNTDCVSDHDSWVLAAYDLEMWIARNFPGANPVFSGPSAKSAQDGWDEWNREKR